MKFIVSNSDFTSLGVCSLSDVPPPPCPNDSSLPPHPPIPPCSVDGHRPLPPAPFPCSGDFNPCLEDFNPHR